MDVTFKDEEKLDIDDLFSENNDVKTEKAHIDNTEIEKNVDDILGNDINGDENIDDGISFPPESKEPEPIKKRRGRPPKNKNIVSDSTEQHISTEDSEHHKIEESKELENSIKLLYDNYSIRTLDELVEIVGWSKNRISREINKARAYTEELYSMNSISEDVKNEIMMKLTPLKVKKKKSVTDLTSYIHDKIVGGDEEQPPVY